ncbi:MAG: winged helix-turn-helix transcriptional regulator [Mycolicibacterium hassiacum]|nr:MarR family winged helix-turn-helix transcriptional regulator [Mycolicibacterium hassiacum]MBX5488458.1 winged helix-turn-helix transcriptional regulator [Mycolicibacterium hassiacum]
MQVLARRAAARHGLSVTQLRVLGWLHVGPPPPARSSALARELNVADPTVSDAIAALIRKGLVQRRTDPRDRRRQDLELTREGRAVAADLARWTAPAEIATSKLDAAAAEGLLQALLEVLARLQELDLLPALRACSTCAFLGPRDDDGRYRCLVDGSLMTVADLRVDCVDHKGRELVGSDQ